MATFVVDSFAEASNTALESHTGETGATWTEHGSYTAGEMGVRASSVEQRVRASTSPAGYYASGVPATAEYDVDCTFKCVTEAAHAGGVAARFATGANTAYNLRYLHTGATTREFQLVKIVAGTETSLGTYSDNIGAGNERVTKLEIRDAAKKVYIAGVERISSADNAITAAGRVGFIVTDGNAAQDARYQFKAFSATDAGGAPPSFEVDYAGSIPQQTLAATVAFTPLFEVEFAAAVPLQTLAAVVDFSEAEYPAPVIIAPEEDEIISGNYLVEWMAGA